MKTTAKGTPKRDGSGRGNRSNRGRGGCATTRKTGGTSKMKDNDIVALVLAMACVFMCSGCVSNVQHIHDPVITLPAESLSEGSAPTIIVIGAQVAAKPVDFGGIISPDTTANARAAASQNGDVDADQRGSP